MNCQPDGIQGIFHLPMRALPSTSGSWCGLLCMEYVSIQLPILGNTVLSGLGWTLIGCVMDLACEENHQLTTLPYLAGHFVAETLQ